MKSDCSILLLCEAAWKLRYMFARRYSLAGGSAEKDDGGRES